MGCSLPALACIVLGETGKGGVTVGRQGNMHNITPCDTHSQGKSTILCVKICASNPYNKNSRALVSAAEFNSACKSHVAIRIKATTHKIAICTPFSDLLKTKTCKNALRKHLNPF